MTKVIKKVPRIVNKEKAVEKLSKAVDKVRLSGKESAKDIAKNVSSSSDHLDIMSQSQNYSSTPGVDKLSLLTKAAFSVLPDSEQSQDSRRKYMLTNQEGNPSAPSKGGFWERPDIDEFAKNQAIKPMRLSHMKTPQLPSGKSIAELYEDDVPNQYRGIDFTPVLSSAYSSVLFKILRNVSADLRAFKESIVRLRNPDSNVREIFQYSSLALRIHLILSELLSQRRHTLGWMTRKASTVNVEGYMKARGMRETVFSHEICHLQIIQHIEVIFSDFLTSEMIGSMQDKFNTIVEEFKTRPQADVIVFSNNEYKELITSLNIISSQRKEWNHHANLP